MTDDSREASLVNLVPGKKEQVWVMPFYCRGEFVMGIPDTSVDSVPCALCRDVVTCEGCQLEVCCLCWVFTDCPFKVVGLGMIGADARLINNSVCVIPGVIPILDPEWEGEAMVLEFALRNLPPVSTLAGTNQEFGLLRVLFPQGWKLRCKFQGILVKGV